MNKLFFALCAITTAVSWAQAPKIDLSKMTVEERREFIYKRLGGYVSKPNMAEGRIVVVNSQKKVDVSVIQRTIGDINEKLHYRISFVDGEFSFPSPKIEGEATLFVIDNEAMPTLLSAPEDRWAMVNLSKLQGETVVNAKLLEARVMKEVTRGFCLLCGTQDSNYKESLLGCKTKPEDLDKHLDCRLPIDIPKRFGPYLAGYGIKPEVVLPYRQACMEGWAAAPTNDVQKAVWDEIHSIPKNPMKIEFDPKKGR